MLKSDIYTEKQVYNSLLSYKYNYIITLHEKRRFIFPTTKLLNIIILNFSQFYFVLFEIRRLKICNI